MGVILDFFTRERAALDRLLFIRTAMEGTLADSLARGLPISEEVADLVRVTTEACDEMLTMAADEMLMDTDINWGEKPAK